MPDIRSLSLTCAIAAAAAAWAGPSAGASAQTAQAGAVTPDRHRQVDALFAPWSSTATPGCAVAIEQAGSLDYTRGYGMASLELGVAIAPDTVFHVASVSKQVTAFAIELLAQEGKLSLQDDVRKYVPELPDFGTPITLSHLMHHTAGLREEGHLQLMAGWQGGDPRRVADVLWIEGRQRSPNFAPGTEVVYTNVAYTLLGLIVQRVSGTSLSAFAEARIFRPLDMRDTRVREHHLEVVPRGASAYGPVAGGGWRISVPVFDYGGPSNLQTTVGDLLKWARNLEDGRVGGRALVQALQTSGTLNSGEAIGYGGGLRLGRYRGLRTVGHDGLDGGYRADLVSFPDQRLTIVALCNAAPADPTAITRQIADLYLGDLRDTLPPAVPMTDAALSALTGVYWSEASDAIVRVELKDGVLRGSEASAPLVPLGDGLFRVGETTQTWRFGASPANASTASAAAAVAAAPRELRIVDFWPTVRVFTRLTAPPPEGAALAAFAGDYRSDEVDMAYTVRVEENRLVMRWIRGGIFTLEAAAGDHFAAGAFTVSFTRSAAGAVDGLTVSSRRMRRLRAERIPAERMPAARVPASRPATPAVRPPSRQP